MKRRDFDMKKMNMDLTQIAGLAGSILTIAATLLTGYANEQKMDKIIDEKVAEALAKQLGNMNSYELAYDGLFFCYSL